ncbi:MAG: GNAT family N-acetyltransferase [Methylocystis sp.]|uniref:GNAT family N-acetyltransferase n=1 Tax=Methylocystis sp. TaxID=1911079 RepID=UPI00395828FE
MTPSPPRPITNADELTAFDCGVPVLDDWLRRRARANQASGASRTYVVCDGPRVIAYYALASGAVAIGAASARLRRNMPDPVPVAVLGRLAIDHTRQRQGLGRALIRDATQRVLQAAETIGIRGVLVHAISTEAAAFYVSLGFEPSPFEALTLMATLSDLRETLR